MLRSFLFVPGDSQKKLARAETSYADALVLDLEDSVATARKQAARGLVADFLAARDPGHRASELWVRINPLDDPNAAADLAAVVPGRPSGLILPKAASPGDVDRLSVQLDRLEAESGVAAGGIKILPITTETASAPFSLGEYAIARLPRLAGLTWGAEDLSAAIGASTNRDANGDWAFTYKMVRSMMLLAASAADVQAIETVHLDYRDSEGLALSSRQARTEGFTGRLAIHPAQVNIINAAFMPDEEEVELARRVVAAFAAKPDAGTVGIDGRMYDIPHLRQARKTLALYEAYGRH